MTDSTTEQAAGHSPRRGGGNDSGRALRSPWFIAWIALVVVVLAVNATMIFLAFATNPGLVVEDYYERGRNVERTLATRRAEAPGWTMSVDVPADVTEGRATTVRFYVVDSSGQPINPERVTFFAYRPSDVSEDFSREMTQEAPGRYAAEINFPISGLWDTLVAAETGEREVVFDQRITVAKP
jgi:nitrogen fixation protein FixH